MAESRTGQLRELQQLNDESREARMRAEHCARKLIQRWLRDCLVVAKASSTKGVFDLAMRATPLPASVVEAVEQALDTQGSGLLRWIEAELDSQDQYAFPWPVRPYKSKEHQGALILTIPNRPLEEW